MPICFRIASKNYFVMKKSLKNSGLENVKFDQLKTFAILKKNLRNIKGGEDIIIDDVIEQ